MLAVVLGCVAPSADEADQRGPGSSPNPSEEVAVSGPSDECILLDDGPIPQLSSEDFDTTSNASIPLFIAHMMDLDGAATLRHVYAVRSTAHELVHYISAEIDAPGLEEDGDFGTWARTGELEGGGLIQAVGETRSFSRFVGNNEAFAMSDESAQASVDCVKSAEES
jgi:hypothetical protein